MKRLFMLLIPLFLLTCQSNNKKSGEVEDAVANVVEVKYHVEGMHCTNCEASIEKGVNFLEGIEFVKANHIDSTTTVSYDINKVSGDEIEKAIEKRGYSVKGKI